MACSALLVPALLTPVSFTPMYLAAISASKPCGEDAVVKVVLAGDVVLPSGAPSDSARHVLGPTTPSAVSPLFC